MASCSLVMRGGNIISKTILVQQAEIGYGITTEADIAVAVRGMKGGRTGGLPGMRVKYLKGWLQEESRKKEMSRR